MHEAVYWQSDTTLDTVLAERWADDHVGIREDPVLFIVGKVRDSIQESVELGAVAQVALSWMIVPALALRYRNGRGYTLRHASNCRMCGTPQSTGASVSL
jgi:hypothetical protein